MLKSKLLVVICVLFGCFLSNGGYNQHFRVLTGLPTRPYTSLKWYSSGNMSEAIGVFPNYVQLICHRFHLTYSWVPTGKSLLTEDTPTQKGVMTHLIEDKGDVAIGAFIPTNTRYQLVEFTAPVLETPFSLVIPSPSSGVNSSALLQPFRIGVWIGLVVCLIAIVFFWYILELIRKYFASSESTSSSASEEATLYVPLSFTLTVILTQGNSVPKRVLSIRLVAGVWCLAAFVLVPAYSGKLTSFLTSTIQKPIIESYKDLITSVPSSSAGLKVAVERGMGVDIQLQLWAKLFESGALNSNIGKMASSVNNSTFRCSNLTTCIVKVAEGDHVTIVGTLQAVDLVRDDWKHYARGTCRVTIAKESFNNAYMVWMTPKNSPLINVLNQGILEIHVYGLSNFWISQSTPRGAPCLKPTTDQAQSGQITLFYLSSTFTVFTIGCGLAIVTFLGEIFFKTHFGKGNRSDLPIS